MAKELSVEERGRVAEEIFAGRKIEAIKLHREATGAGLKEAKDGVDAMEVELRRASPERFGAKGKSGCLGVLLLAALPVGGAVGFLL